MRACVMRSNCGCYSFFFWLPSLLSKTSSCAIIVRELTNGAQLLFSLYRSWQERSFLYGNSFTFFFFFFSVDKGDLLACVSKSTHETPNPKRAGGFFLGRTRATVEVAQKKTLFTVSYLLTHTHCC